jgi:hypothetical protein
MDHDATLALGLPIGPSPYAVLDRLYAEGVTPADSDGLVKAVCICAGFTGRAYLEAIVAAHRLRRYQAETGNPF